MDPQRHVRTVPCWRNEGVQQLDLLFELDDNDEIVSSCKFSNRKDERRIPRQVILLNSLLTSLLYSSNERHHSSNPRAASDPKQEEEPCGRVMLMKTLAGFRTIDYSCNSPLFIRAAFCILHFAFCILHASLIGCCVDFLHSIMLSFGGSSGSIPITNSLSTALYSQAYQE